MRFVCFISKLVYVNIYKVNSYFEIHLLKQLKYNYLHSPWITLQGNVLLVRPLVLFICNASLPFHIEGGMGHRSISMWDKVHKS